MRSVFPKAAKKVLWLCAICFMVSGCAVTQYEYQSTPVIARVETPAFTAGFTPQKSNAGYFSWFELTLENLSHTPMAIDWNRTRYLVNKGEQGGFIWKGIDPESIGNKTIPLDEVAPGQRFSKQIAPQSTIAVASRKNFSAGKDRSAFYTGILPPGENAILLALVVDGQIVSHTLAVQITETQKE